MNGKVKLTKEQAAAVEQLKSLYQGTSQKRMNLTLIREKLQDEYGWESEELIDANGIPDSDFIAALHYDYEIIPQFKTGDWITVFHEDGTFKYTVKITSLVDDEHVTVDIESALGYDLHINLCGYGIVRLATEEEIKKEKNRRLFASIDREPNECKIGDVIVRKSDPYTSYFVKDVNDKTGKIKDDCNAWLNYDEIRIVAPVDWRLDNKTDE